MKQMPQQTFHSRFTGEEEAVPAKKSKTIISASQISQTRQTRVEKVSNSLNSEQVATVFQKETQFFPLYHCVNCYFLLTEDGGSLRGLCNSHDANACRGWGCDPAAGT